MANKSLGTATAVTSVIKSNSLFVEIGGAVRRITMENFMAAMNEGQVGLLQQVAWGIPLKDEMQTSPEWGMIGNTAAFTAYKAKMGRYLMDANGRAAKLSPIDSSVFADGTTLDETKGSVVVIAPRLYYLVQTSADNTFSYLWCSEYPISAHYIGNANNGNLIVLGAYKGSISNNKLVSRSGVDFDTSGKTIEAYWAAAQAFGTNWGLKDYDHVRWISMLCLAEANGNANAQSVLGYGVGGSTGYEWSNITGELKKTGKTKSLGDATGTVAITGAQSDSTHVSVCGLEDLWNLQWEFVQGIFFGSNSNSGQDGTEVFIYDGNRLPSSTERASHPNGHYRQLAGLIAQGYANGMIKGEFFDLIATAVAGSSNQSWCDYFNGTTTGQLCRIGGDSRDGSKSGPLYIDEGAWNNAYGSFGARPAYYGPVTIVDGKDI